MKKMNLNIQTFGFWIDPGVSQSTANNIVSKHNEIKSEISGLNSSFINGVNSVWYTGTAERTTHTFSGKVNDRIVTPLQGNFETLLSNYIGTVNNLLSESGETIGGSLEGPQNTNVEWQYSAGSKNILPDTGELGDFVNNTAVPRLESIRDLANELASLLEGAGDMDAASKSAMIADVKVVATNADSLSQEVQSLFVNSAAQEEANVQEIQNANQSRS